MTEGTPPPVTQDGENYFSASINGLPAAVGTITARISVINISIPDPLSFSKKYECFNNLRGAVVLLHPFHHQSFPPPVSHHALYDRVNALTIHKFKYKLDKMEKSKRRNGKGKVTK